MRRSSLAFCCASAIIAVALVGCGGSGQTPPPTPPQQDFTLTLSAQSVFVPSGVGSGSVQISVQGENGFDQTVSVSLSGLPSGVTTSPALPVMVSAGSNQTITLTAASNTTIGVQSISVQATSGTLNHSASFSLSVAAPSYAYLATGYPNEPPYDLVGFAVDANTGALAQVPGSPVSLPAEPVDLAVASETGGAFVFVLIPDSSTQTVTLQSYSVDAGTGTLTPLQTINYPPQTNQSALAVHPSGTFLYVMEDGCLLAYSIDPATGNLTQASCSSGMFGPNQSFVVAAPGNFAYQTEVEPLPPGTLYLYSVNQTDGSVTLLQSMQSADGVGGSLFTDPQSRALYQIIGPSGVGSCGRFVTYSIDADSGVLTSLNSSFAPLCEPFSIAFTPADTFGYVSSGPGESSSQKGIYGATVDATTGNLTNISGSPFGAGSGADFGAVEPSQGKFLLQHATVATSSGNTAQVLVYAIDPSSGALTQVSGVQPTLPSGTASVYKMLAVSPAH